jgi:hypothetical protein
VNVFHAATADEKRLGEEADIDVSWLVPLHGLVERAVAAGHGEHSIAALTELLRTPGTAAAR